MLRHGNCCYFALQNTKEPMQWKQPSADVSAAICAPSGAGDALHAQAPEEETIQKQDMWNCSHCVMSIHTLEQLQHHFTRSKCGGIALLGQQLPEQVFEQSWTQHSSYTSGQIRGSTREIRPLAATQSTSTTIMPLHFLSHAASLCSYFSFQT